MTGKARGNLEVTFEVRGTGPFPIDMLRYDSCIPASEADSNVIAVTHTPGYRRDTEKVVKLRKYTAVRGVAPATEGRWQSFGWTVVHA